MKTSSLQKFSGIVLLAFLAACTSLQLPDGKKSSSTTPEITDPVLKKMIQKCAAYAIYEKQEFMPELQELYYQKCVEKQGYKGVPIPYAIHNFRGQPVRPALLNDPAYIKEIKNGTYPDFKTPGAKIQRSYTKGN